jgi:hypothetical protein
MLNPTLALRRKGIQGILCPVYFFLFYFFLHSPSFAQVQWQDAYESRIFEVQDQLAQGRMDSSTAQDLLFAAGSDAYCELWILILAEEAPSCQAEPYLKQSLRIEQQRYLQDSLPTWSLQSQGTGSQVAWSLRLRQRDSNWSSGRRWFKWQSPQKHSSVEWGDLPHHPIQGLIPLRAPKASQKGTFWEGNGRDPNGSRWIYQRHHHSLWSQVQWHSLEALPSQDSAQDSGTNPNHKLLALGYRYQEWGLWGHWDPQQNSSQNSQAWVHLYGNLPPIKAQLSHNWGQDYSLRIQQEAQGEQWTWRSKWGHQNQAKLSKWSQDPWQDSTLESMTWYRGNFEWKDSLWKLRYTQDVDLRADNLRKQRLGLQGTRQITQSHLHWREGLLLQMTGQGDSLASYLQGEHAALSSIWRLSHQILLHSPQKSFHDWSLRLEIEPRTQKHFLEVRQTQNLHTWHLRLGHFLQFHPQGRVEAYAGSSLSHDKLLKPLGKISLEWRL